jgi:hypothetical protein
MRASNILFLMRADLSTYAIVECFPMLLGRLHGKGAISSKQCAA